MSYTPTTWTTGDTITASAMNKIEQGIAEGGSGYDLIIVVESNHNPLLPEDCEIVKGDLLELEQKIVDGEIVNGVCLVKEYYSWTSANITRASIVLPLVNWYGPYAFLMFGGSYPTTSNSTTITVDGVHIRYDYSDGSILNVSRLTKTI